MMVLLAVGIGLGAIGLVAVVMAIPISDSSFGNGLLISGVIVACTGFVLVGLALAVRDLKKALAGSPVRDVDVRLARPKAQASPNPLFPPQPGNAGRADVAAPERAEASPQGPAESPPWADETATRGRAHPAVPETVAPVVEPPPAPPQPERPARRNLLFSIKRRDRVEPEIDAAPVPRTALESEPAVSFENAWPQSPRADLDTLRGEAAPDIRPGTEPAPAPDTPELEPVADGLTVVKSGVVDGMSYTLFSDGSIEARLSGEDPIRFGSLDALRTYLDQRQ